MAITGRGRFPFRSAWGFRARSRKPGAAFLSKRIRFGDTDTADSAMLKNFFQPVTGASYNLSITTSSFAVTPNTTALRAARNVSATVSSFAVTPTATTLRRTRKLTAVAASIALSANIVGLSVANRISAQSSSFTTTPNVVSLRAHRYLPAEAPMKAPTLFIEGVSDTELTLTWTVVSPVTGLAAQGVSDTALSLSWNPSQSASDYNFSTNDATLARGVTLPIDTSSLAITVNNARLFKTPAAVIAEPPLTVPRNFTAVNDASGMEAIIQLDWQLGAGVLISPNDAVLRVANRLPITSSSFAITPFAINFPVGVSIAPVSGTFTITPNATALRRQRRLSAQTGSFSITGNAIQFRNTNVMQAQSSTITITGNPATLTYTPISDFVLTATPGSFSFTPNAVTFRYSKALVAQPAVFTFTGFDPFIFAGIRHTLDEPLSIDMSTGQTFINFNKGTTQLIVTTGRTRIDIE